MRLTNPTDQRWMTESDGEQDDEDTDEDEAEDTDG